MNNKVYGNCLKLTQQFRFCPNAFRVDTYKGCNFGCKYCFANADAENFKSSKYEFSKCADIKQIKNTFAKAFDTDKEYDELNIELLRHRVPLHCGGLADPFQKREEQDGITHQLIELSNHYNYPILFSTKSDYIKSETLNILNPNIHAFQSSLIGLSDEFIRKWETNTPLPKDRIKFLQLLKSKNFWIAIRLQPLIDIKEASDLLEFIKDLPNYITVEHLRLPTPHVSLYQEFLKYYPDKENIVNHSRMFEVITSVKKEHIKIIKKIAHKYGYKVGVGDNDLHFLSESRCCCGIDCINEQFQNYLKYNVTYMTTGDWTPDDLWYPKSNCKYVMNQKLYGHKKFVGYEDLLKEYLNKHKNVVDRVHQQKIDKTVYGISQKSLF